MVDILVLGVVFMMQVVEGMELEVRCFVRLALWCANRRGYFLCHFSLKLVEMNRLTVDGVFLGWQSGWIVLSFWSMVSWARR